MNFTGAVGQQTWFMLPLESQSQQLQHPSVSTFSRASLSQQPKTEIPPRNFQKNSLFSIRGRQQQQQRVLTSASSESILPTVRIYRCDL